MRRLAVIGTAVTIMVIMATAGVAVAQEFPGSDQYGTTPPPADIAAFVAALLAFIFDLINELLAGLFGSLFG